jgi:GT2 family glycosyltransferase
MDLSIIIVTHNSEKYILNCLNSITRATRGIHHEFLIIDNKSTDQTKVFIRQFTNSLTLIENTENHGFAKAINMGLERGSGEFILLMNPDVLIQSESLQPTIDFLRDHPEIGICGCKLLNQDDSLQYSKGSFPTLFATLYRMALPRRMRKYNLWGYEKAGECDWVTGAFMMIRNEMYREVGPLDERYFMHYEDVDYCLQAKKMGWFTYYFPGISAYHLNPHASSNKNRNLSLEREIRKSQLYFFKKNNSQTSYHVLAILAWMFFRVRSFSKIREREQV